MVSMGVVYISFGWTVFWEKNCPHFISAFNAFHRSLWNSTVHQVLIKCQSYYHCIWIFMESEIKRFYLGLWIKSQFCGKTNGNCRSITTFLDTIYYYLVGQRGALADITYTWRKKLFCGFLYYVCGIFWWILWWYKTAKWR